VQYGVSRLRMHMRMEMVMTVVMKIRELSLKIFGSWQKFVQIYIFQLRGFSTLVSGHHLHVHGNTTLSKLAPPQVIPIA
jgi:hypothetical protein